MAVGVVRRSGVACGRWCDRGFVRRVLDRLGPGRLACARAEFIDAFDAAVGAGARDVVLEPRDAVGDMGSRREVKAERLVVDFNVRNKFPGCKLVCNCAELFGVCRAARLCRIPDAAGIRLCLGVQK